MNEIQISEEINLYNYLNSIKNTIFENQESKSILESKIFTGKTSVKWFRIIINGDDEKRELITRIESPSNYYNTIQENMLDDISMKRYACIKIAEKKYLMRMLLSSGFKTVQDGISLRRIPNIKNVVLLIDLDNLFVEIRSSSTEAKKIIKSLSSLLNFGYNDVQILYNYNNSIEEFRDSLINGKFIDVTSVPLNNLCITNEQSNVLLGIINAIDEYCFNKDIEKLNESISLVEIDLLEEMPFTQFFLAGMAKIGIEIRPDIEDDLSCQSLFTFIKTYITHHRGFIRFSSNISNDELHTIQVGIDTNSISFRSMVSETEITYIRNKVLGL